MVSLRNGFSNIINASYKALEPFRKARRDTIRKFASNYGDRDLNNQYGRNALNLLEFAISIYMQKLFSGDPQIKITPMTNDINLRLLATKFERGCNGYIKTHNIREHIERAIQDAFFCMGIAKVASDYEGPYVEHVSLEDWVHDMNAPSFDKCEFMGNRYEVLYADIAEMYPDLSKEKLQLIKNSVDTNRSRQKESSLINNTMMGTDNIYEKVNLWDIYLPIERKVITMLAQDGVTNDITSDLILSEQDWESPIESPFIILGFQQVPDQTVPLAPAMTLESLSDYCNELFHKIKDQALREKTVFAVQPGAEGDAERIKAAEDGEFITINNPKGTEEFHIGGPNNITVATFIQGKDLFSWRAGNLDTLGGLATGADTLGQELLLDSNASESIKSLQNKSALFIRKVLTALADHIYHDSNIDLTVTWQAPGYEDVVYYEKLTPKERYADFKIFNLEIEPYSLQHRSPEAKLQFLNTVITQTIAPFMANMVQQGVILDYEQLFKLVAEYSNVPELNWILKYTQPRLPDTANQSGSSMPAFTKREYVRKNVPGASRQQKDQMMSNLMMGGNVQPAEKATMNRNVS